MVESWVINASPVILLAKVGLIDRIPAIADPLVIPQPVAVEILSVRDKDDATLWLNGPGKLFIRPAVPVMAAMAGYEIGAGERAVIAWASVHRGFVAVLDDYEARVAAKQLNVPMLGTVGVVLRLKKAGLISEVRPHLLKIKNVGGYIGDELFREALRSAEEQP